MRDGLTPPDLIVIDGVRGQVNIAKQVIQEELGWTFLSQACKRMTSTRPMNCSSVIPLQVIELSGASQEFSSCNGSKMKSTVSPSPSTASYGPRIPSPLSWMASKVWDQKRKQLLMKHFKVTDQDPKEATVDEIVTVGIPRAVAEAVQEK